MEYVGGSDSGGYTTCYGVYCRHGGMCVGGRADTVGEYVVFVAVSSFYGAELDVSRGL